MADETPIDQSTWNEVAKETLTPSGSWGQDIVELFRGLLDPSLQNKVLFICKAGPNACEYLIEKTEAEIQTLKNIGDQPAIQKQQDVITILKWIISDRENMVSRLDSEYQKVTSSKHWELNGLKNVIRKSSPQKIEKRPPSEIPTKKETGAEKPTYTTYRNEGRTTSTDIYIPKEQRSADLQKIYADTIEKRAKELNITLWWGRFSWEISQALDEVFSNKNIPENAKEKFFSELKRKLATFVSTFKESHITELQTTRSIMSLGVETFEQRKMSEAEKRKYFFEKILQESLNNYIQPVAHSLKRSFEPREQNTEYNKTSLQNFKEQVRELDKKNNLNISGALWEFMKPPMDIGNPLDPNLKKKFLEKILPQVGGRPMDSILLLPFLDERASNETSPSSSRIGKSYTDILNKIRPYLQAYDTFTGLEKEMRQVRKIATSKNDSIQEFLEIDQLKNDFEHIVPQNIEERVKRANMSDTIIMMTQAAQIIPLLGDALGAKLDLTGSISWINVDGKILTIPERVISSLFWVLGITMTGVGLKRLLQAKKSAQLIETLRVLIKNLPDKYKQFEWQLPWDIKKKIEPIFQTIASIVPKKTPSKIEPHNTSELQKYTDVTDGIHAPMRMRSMQEELWSLLNEDLELIIKRKEVLAWFGRENDMAPLTEIQRRIRGLKESHPTIAISNLSWKDQEKLYEWLTNKRSEKMPKITLQNFVTQTEPIFSEKLSINKRINALKEKNYDGIDPEKVDILKEEEINWNTMNPNDSRTKNLIQDLYDQNIGEGVLRERYFAHDLNKLDTRDIQNTILEALRSKNSPETVPGFQVLQSFYKDIAEKIQWLRKAGFDFQALDPSVQEHLMHYMDAKKWMSADEIAKKVTEIQKQVPNLGEISPHNQKHIIDLIFQNGRTIDEINPNIHGPLKIENLNLTSIVKETGHTPRIIDIWNGRVVSMTLTSTTQDGSQVFTIRYGMKAAMGDTMYPKFHWVSTLIVHGNEYNFLAPLNHLGEKALQSTTEELTIIKQTLQKQGMQENTTIALSEKNQWIVGRLSDASIGMTNTINAKLLKWLGWDVRLLKNWKNLYNAELLDAGVNAQWQSVILIRAKNAEGKIALQAEMVLKEWPNGERIIYMGAAWKISGTNENLYRVIPWLLGSINDILWSFWNKGKIYIELFEAIGNGMEAPLERLTILEAIKKYTRRSSKVPKITP